MPSLVYLGVAVVFSIAVGMMSTSEKGKWLLTALLGAMLSLMGATTLVSGSIPQTWHGGPPLEGPAAKVGGILLLAFGIFLLYRTVSRNPTQPPQ